MKKYIVQLVFVLSVLPFIQGCSGGREVSSSVTDNEIIIDGIQTDWTNLNYIDGENISFGFKNDASNLYMCVITSDRNKIMKMLRGGLTIWLEPDNSDDLIGVRYPDKADPSEIMKLRRDNIEMQPPANDDSRLNNILQIQNELYIVKENNFVLNAFPVNGESYKANIDITDGKFFYELKIPFFSNSNINGALKSESGNTLSVVFETGEMEKLGMQRRPPEGMGEPDDEQMPGNMGDRPEGRGFGRGPGMNMDTSPMKYKFKLKLN